MYLPLKNGDFQASHVAFRGGKRVRDMNKWFPISYWDKCPKDVKNPMGVKLDGFTLVPETSIVLILGYQLDDEPIHDY